MWKKKILGRAVGIHFSEIKMLMSAFFLKRTKNYFFTEFFCFIRLNINTKIYMKIFKLLGKW